MSAAGARAAVNPLDAVRPAGRMFQGRDESVAYCLHMPDVEPVSEHVARYQTVREPGTRVRHFGYRGDALDESKVFGSVDKRPPVHSSDVLNTRKAPAVELMESRAEEAYYKSVKRAPLGHVAVPGMSPGDLPARVAKPDFAFGTLSGGGAGVRADGGNAKESLFPVSPPAADEALGEKLYAKSHGSYAPGVRRDLGVSWVAAGIDPTAHTFGKKATAGTVGVGGATGDGAAAVLSPHSAPSPAERLAATGSGAAGHAAAASTRLAATGGAAASGRLASDAASLLASGRLIPKAVADFQAKTADEPGVTRGKGVADYALHPPVYGKASRGKRDAGDWTAADCLRGDFSTEDQQPDITLGRSISRVTRKGAAAEAASLPPPGRRFGVPSIRTDIAPRPVQSIASEADFGSGPSAGSLLAPSPYAEHGVEEADFVRPRAAGELKSIFEATGTVKFASDEEFEAVYAHACVAHGLTPPGMASVEEFRRSLDAVLEAREAGEEAPAWFAAAMGGAAGLARSALFGTAAATGRR